MQLNILISRIITTAIQIIGCGFQISFDFNSQYQQKQVLLWDIQETDTYIN